MNDRLVTIAIPAPLHREFTYLVPAALSARIEAGTRVLVPFGGRKVIGVVTADTTVAPPVTPKAILAAPDDQPAMDAPMLGLCRWIAGYYAAPLGLVLRAALPAALTGADAPSPPPKQRRILTITRELPTLMERDTLFARAPKQREVYELLEQLDGRAAVSLVLERLGVGSAVLQALVKRGLAAFTVESVSRDPFALRATPTDQVHEPSPAQAEAIATLAAGAPGTTFLLHGITGSGKTLVYLEFLRQVVTVGGQGAIVLVPEIALTPQTVDRFRAVFGDQVAVLHSALSDGERLDAWRALRSGEKTIAVGPRSAVFAPVANLGAIVVDEEHEASYKQHEAPRYHAREVAIVRAGLSGAVCVLGSATPSLETWVNAERGKYVKLGLPERAGMGRLPTVQVVNLATQPAGHADPVRRVLSALLEVAIRDTLARQEQVILLLNRRGYAAFVQCGSCGDVATCPNCSISLTYHRTPERLICHYCQHAEPPRTTCRECQSPTLARRGIGTQQLERLLAERFPSARLARMDVDTTSAKWAHAEILDRVGRGEVDLLLGTQMIAKGLDFPNVTLVGVIDADVGINLPDFRASERCFQLLAQVAGRAGRGPKGGQVLIQTRSPGHHAVQCALTHDYLRFVREELEGRNAPPYPPMVRLANIIASGLHEGRVQELAEAAATWLREAVVRRNLPGLQIIGPAPSAIERVKLRYRWHVLVKSDAPGPLTTLAREFVVRFPVPKTDALRVAFDRDPATLL